MEFAIIKPRKLLLMPILEFRCEDCFSEFEELVDDEMLLQCLFCSSKNVVRASEVRFKIDCPGCDKRETCKYKIKLRSNN